ncbi:MAG: hypothetical protein ACREB9_05225, partial [Thermoplasmata archaeon]
LAQAAPPPSSCSSPGESSNCHAPIAGAVAVPHSLPPILPATPTWTPCLGHSYSLCATANYPGTVDVSNAGTLTAIAASGASGTWMLVSTSLGEWAGVTYGADGDLQIYLLY